MDKFVVRTKIRHTSRDKGGGKGDKVLKTHVSRRPFQEDMYHLIGKGHQVDERGSTNSSYFAARRKKLAEQAPAKQSNLFHGAVFYLNGYLGSAVSDLHLRDLVYIHGGSIALGLALRTVTHMVCTSLAGGKKQKLLTRRKNGLKIVSPEWILDSVKNKRRMPEVNYTVINDETQLSISEFTTQGKSQTES
ncbi:BRCT domain-containing protein [Phlyctochytrium arcticum]|nr:BRCT domain-containing protein [Phlyctochytrium arcticum]